MPRNARIPRVDTDDNRMLTIVELLECLVLERCERGASWLEMGKAARTVVADIMWQWEQQRLEQAVTDAAGIEVDGLVYRPLKQSSNRVYHGLYGAHVVEEPLYRLEGVRNGPTVRPLDQVVGVVSGSLLPDLAQHLGRESTSATSREVEKSLERLGFRPPSRATIQKRTGALFASMDDTIEVLEEEVRAEERLEFELCGISCGLDRFAVRMDEDLPDGDAREAKLAAQETRLPEYRRRPPEPYEVAWRMAWAANITLYDSARQPRRTLWFGADAEADVSALVSRMVADIDHLLARHPGVPVTVVQDGAPELAVLPEALQRQLPRTATLRVLTDFPHAIAYLDKVVAARSDLDPHNWRAVYRYWLLDTPNGAERVVRHLRVALRKLERADHSDDKDAVLAQALSAALSYFEKRRPLMKYHEARAMGLPIGSGATESTCKMHQHRVKRSGSHWRSAGLRPLMTARSLAISGRFESAFELHHATLCSEVRKVA